MSFCLDVYFLGGKKGVPVDVISKPCSAYSVLGAVWGPFFLGAEMQRERECSFPLLAYCTHRWVLFSREVKSSILIFGSNAVIVLTTWKDGLLFMQ